MSLTLFKSDWYCKHEYDQNPDVEAYHYINKFVVLHAKYLLILI